jgi:hypothetical protein
VDRASNPGAGKALVVKTVPPRDRVENVVAVVAKVRAAAVAADKVRVKAEAAEDAARILNRLNANNSANARPNKVK